MYVYIYVCICMYVCMCVLGGPFKIVQCVYEDKF